MTTVLSSREIITKDAVCSAGFILFSSIYRLIEECHYFRTDNKSLCMSSD